MVGAIGGVRGRTVTAMTSHLRPHQLDDLRTEWRSVGRSRAAREALAVLKAEHPPLAETRAEDLGDLVELLEPSSGLSQLERAQLAAALLATADQHPLLARALLQTLLPGLVSVARKLDWGRGRSEDAATFLGDLITAAYEVIAEWAGQERAYAAPDLLNAVRCRMRRRLVADGSPQFVPLESMGKEEPMDFDVVPDEDLAVVLALCTGPEDRLGVLALYGREVLGFTYKELAARTGYSARSLSEASKAVARRILG